MPTEIGIDELIVKEETKMSLEVNSCSGLVYSEASISSFSSVESSILVSGYWSKILDRYKLIAIWSLLLS